MKKLREKHGRFYVYPCLENFEHRSAARRCFTRSGARRLSARLNKEEDTLLYSIGYWSMDGRDGWYPAWLAFLDKHIL